LRHTNNPKHILAVTIGGLGDAILFSPVIKALRSKYAHAFVHLMVASPLAECAFAPAPEIDRISVVNTNNRLKFFRLLSLLFFAFRARLRHGGFDIGVFATGLNPRLEVLLRGAAKIKQTYCAPGVGEFKTDLGCNVALARKFDPNISKHDVFLPITMESQQETISVLKQHNITLGDDSIVAIYPSKVLPHRPRWALENFVEIIKSLRKYGFQGKFVVIGSRGEGVEWESINGGRWVDANLAGELSIQGNAVLLKECCLTIGNDGGAMHIAGAKNCPQVVIMTNTPLNYKPPGDQTIIIRSNLSCCTEIFPNRPDGCQEAKCSEDITVRDVYQACLRVLEIKN